MHGNAIFIFGTYFPNIQGCFPVVVEHACSISWRPMLSHAERI